MPIQGWAIKHAASHGGAVAASAGSGIASSHGTRQDPTGVRRACSAAPASLEPMINTATETVDRVRAEIRSVTREILREPDLTIGPDDELRDRLGLDSADLAELVVTLETNLEATLPDAALAPSEETDPLSTVDTLANAVAAEIDHADG